MFLFYQIIDLLNRAQKKQAAILLVLMFVGMIFETLGVGLIVPLLVLISDPDFTSKYPFTITIIAYLGNPPQVQLIVWALLTLVGVYTFKFIFMVFVDWQKAQFTGNVKIYQARHLFAAYLHQPYTFHLQHNSANLIRNIMTDVVIYNGGLISMVGLIAESLVFSGIVTLLIWVEPLGSLISMIVLIAAGMLFHRVTQSRLTKWGNAVRFHTGKSLQHLKQGLDSIKEIKLLGREEKFKAQYNIHNIGLEHAAKRQRMFHNLPRLWFEFLVGVGLSSLMLSMLIQDKSPNELAPVLGLFAVAAFRLMPSMVRIFTALQDLRYARPSITKVYQEFTILFNTEEKKSPKYHTNIGSYPFKTWQSIRIENLCYTYPNTHNSTLTDININIERGSSVGFIGGSGAGKTTLIDVILGLLVPTKGSIKINGFNVRDYLRDWQDQIGYVPQSIFLTDDTIYRNVALGIAEEDIDKTAVQKAIKAAQLDKHVASLERGLNTEVGEYGVKLSGGQRQRIGIARALYHNPTVLVLDEATSALDASTEQGFVKAVEALHGIKTLLIIAHRMTTVEKCDWIYKIENGKIIQQGTYEEITSSYR